MDNFNTYNARYLNAEQVADSFINSNNYKVLLNNNNSIILGARGCGKTTLMKMLTLPALYSWKDQNAEEIRDNLKFYSIYISTDIYWDAKNKSYENQFSQEKLILELISKFTVNSNVFIATCETFLNILKYEKINYSLEQEIELSNYLINRWKLINTLPMLVHVREALLNRIDDVNQKIKRIIFNRSENDKADFIASEFLYLDFDTSLNSIFDKFSIIYNVDFDKKWALCFDELEFAPKWLQTFLYRSLRSRNNQKILYKISSSPILPKELENIFMQDYSASNVNDFDCIKMWTLDNEEEFTSKLINELLKNKGIKVKAKDYFKSNNLYLDKKIETYDNDSEYINQMIELSSKDAYFRSYLESKDIDPSNPSPKDSKQKASVFRKIKPVVYFRNYFIKSNNSEKDDIEYRTRRKSTELYSGYEIILKICEGNPRWLISLINTILEKTDDSSTIDNKIQYDVIIDLSNRFMNSIENIPIQLNEEIKIKDFINKIGKCFENEILGRNFKQEPSSSFKVDIDSNDYLTIIEKGIFQGAFIIVDNESNGFDFDVANKKLKLSYMYYPFFKLPIRRGKEISLCKILSQDNKNNNKPLTLF